MRVETNERLVKWNTRLAHGLFFGTMGILAVAFFVANQQFFGQGTESTSSGLALIISSLMLPVGMISTIFSVRLTNLWVRKPRPEIAIREGLKGLSAKSVLYNYYHFPARHVLITPQGVFAIVTRWQDGNYSVEGDAWKTHQGGFSRLLRIFRYDGLGNPNQDAVRAVARVRKHLEPIAPEVEVQPLIIFVDPRATLEVNDPIIPAVYADSKQKPNLKDYLRAFSRETEETEANGSKSKKRNQQKSVKENPMPLTPEQIEAFEVASIGR